MPVGPTERDRKLFGLTFEEADRPMVSCRHVILLAITTASVRCTSGPGADRLCAIPLGSHRQECRSSAGPAMATSSSGGRAAHRRPPGEPKPWHEVIEQVEQRLRPKQ